MATIVVRDGSRHIPTTRKSQGGTSIASFGSGGASEITVVVPTVDFTVDDYFTAQFIDRADPEQAILLNETIKIAPQSIAGGVLTVKIYSIAAIKIYGNYEFIWRVM